MLTAVHVLLTVGAIFFTAGSVLGLGHHLGWW